MAAPDIPIHPEQAPRSVSREGVAVREDSLHANHKGKENKGVRKRAAQALARLRAPLAKVLENDEVVLYVARAQAPASLTDQFTFGWMIYYFTATALVITNRRLLRFNIKQGSFGRWSWGGSVRSVRWGDVAEAKTKGMLLSRSLLLRYQNGTKEKYWGLKGVDAKKINLLIRQLLPASVGEGSAAQAMTALCPDCLAALPAQQYQCAQCGLGFKNEREMLRYSLLFPGGGYFYVGQTGLAILDAIVEVFILSWLLVWVLVAFGMPEPGLGPLERAATPGEAATISALLAFLLVLEKAVTIHHGRRFVRDLIPVRAPQKSTRWAVIGGISYAVVALVVGAQIPRLEPIAEVTPDLQVVDANFGLFKVGRSGTYEFAPAAVVPLGTGQEYGWVIRLRTSRETVKLIEEIRFPYPLQITEESPTPGGLTEKEDPHILTGRYEVETEGGVVFHTWEVTPQDEPGNYVIQIYLEDVPVYRFAFQMR